MEVIPARKRNGCISFFRLPKDEKLKKKWLLTKEEKTIRTSHQRCSLKKGVLKNFAKFIGKHLRWSLFLMKLLSRDL